MPVGKGSLDRLELAARDEAGETIEEKAEENRIHGGADPAQAEAGAKVQSGESKKKGRGKNMARKAQKQNEELTEKTEAKAAVPAENGGNHPETGLQPDSDGRGEDDRPRVISNLVCELPVYLL